MTRHDATNDATNDATERDNVSFEEAARRLGVSLRTVQRRVKDGNLNSIESDGARLVCLARAATRRDNDATPRQIDATQRDTPQAGSTPDVAASLAQSREEILFLRGLIEQRDRDAAELRAALREALKAMPKAITAGNESTPIEASQAPIIPPGDVAPVAQKQSPQNGTQRKMRPWQRAIMRMIGAR
jgi:excisionase family DNA binding protein